MNILETVGSGTEQMAVVRRRQIAFFGHIVTANYLKKLEAEGH